VSLAAKAARGAVRAEDAVSIAAIALLAALPLLEIVLRKTLRVGIPGSILIVQHLTLIVTFAGAALAARSDRLLALESGTFLPASWRPPARWFAYAVGVGLCAWLVRGGVGFALAERQGGKVLVLGIRSWAVVAVMPLGVALIGLRLAWLSSERPLWRALAFTGLAIPLVLGSEGAGGSLLLPGIGLIIVAAALGLPIFAALGGLALLAFHSVAVPAATVPASAYTLATLPVLPAVPLFTLTGYILAAGKASDRVVRTFDALVGWLPGGPAIVTTLVFAFFTSFTGASGVTILSLGGLLYPVLVKSRFGEEFSLGLVTVSGSIGLLLPPSIPIMLYAVRAQLPIDKMFLGGILPGILLVVLVALLGVREGRKVPESRKPFAWREAAAAARGALWELLLPVVMLVAIFGGFATTVEAAALTVLWALLIQCVIHRDVSITRDLPKIFLDAAILVGGFLIILSVALALTDYFNFAEIPDHALAFVQAHVHSKVVFLLALNVFLLIVGAMMDIYSAIFVVVPLVTPMAVAYGIDPIHLGIIFLANLELGYLTPPMGENLFLAAYRFDKPVLGVFRATLPFYAIIAAGVLLITYVPAMTLWLAR
jgi:tripartite ATP-independent transporter DctM subunit